MEAKRKCLTREKGVPPTQDATGSADTRPADALPASRKEMGKVITNGRNRKEVKKGEDQVKNKSKDSSAPPHKVLHVLHGF